MSGALIDLVAKGVQDSYITGQPEVSFFRQTHKRHTNFATKPVLLDYRGTLAAGGQISIKIPPKGDLLTGMWMDLGTGTDTIGGITGNGINADTTSPATFDLLIGGQLVDRQDATFIAQVWNKYLVDSGAKTMAAYSTTPASATDSMDNLMSSTWLPLHFFCCDGVSLPLVALQYHEVELRVTFSGTGVPSAPKFYANYVLLDTDERKQVVDQSHEILIHQMQKIYSDGVAATPRFDLTLLNHPVKALFWVAPATGTTLATNDVQLYLNGTEVFEERMPDKYFTHVQGYYHCEHASPLLRGATGAEGANVKMYSFALKVNKHQPTGTCNFSRIDTASLHVGAATNAPASNFPLYAVNYNILRIKNGVSGVAFAN